MPKKRVCKYILLGFMTFAMLYSSPVDVQGQQPVVPNQVTNQINYEGIANVKAYGAIGDGVTDDTKAIQRALNEENTVFFPKGTYIVTKPLQCKSHSVQLDTYATIKAHDGFAGDYLIEFTSQPVDWKTPKEFAGGILDGNGVTNGFKLTNIRHAHVHDFVVKNAKDIGVYVAKPSADYVSSDEYVDHIVVYGTGKTHYAFVIDGNDNNLRDLRTYDCLVGVQLNDGGQYLADIHPVGMSDAHPQWEETAAFEINAGDMYLTNCYADNFRYGVRINGKYPVYSSNLFIYHYSHGDKPRTGVKFGGKKKNLHFVNTHIYFPKEGENVEYLCL